MTSQSLIWDNIFKNVKENDSGGVNWIYPAQERF